MLSHRGFLAVLGLLSVGIVINVLKQIIYDLMNKFKKWYYLRRRAIVSPSSGHLSSLNAIPLSDRNGNKLLHSDRLIATTDVKPQKSYLSLQRAQSFADV